jgi:hypothetical protein
MGATSKRHHGDSTLHRRAVQKQVLQSSNSHAYGLSYTRKGKCCNSAIHTFVLDDLRIRPIDFIIGAICDVDIQSLQRSPCGGCAVIRTHISPKGRCNELVCFTHVGDVAFDGGLDLHMATRSTNIHCNRSASEMPCACEPNCVCVRHSSLSIMYSSAS